MKELKLKKDRDLSPYKNLSESSNLHMQQRADPRGSGHADNNTTAPISGQPAGNLIKTSTGAYNVDFEAEYAARKLE
jgi:hypothetical protein